jgi:tagatose 1,6-diphosphate aldolase
MDRLDDLVRRRRQEALDEVRAGDGKSAERSIIVQREPDHVFLSRLWYADVTAAKRLLVENLAPHCSSMLFDPNFAVPAAIDLLPARCGLIMTLEEHHVEETPGGRKSRAITNWSVEKIRAMGGDAVKVLAWSRPDAGPAVNEHQKRFVREIGQDCAL